MALGHAVEAKVQKPLATVVIGGSLSAILLTLFGLLATYGRFGAAASLDPKDADIFSRQAERMSEAGKAQNAFECRFVGLFSSRLTPSGFA